ncbi:right-handed parallel beta-helix repeat-containing protein [Streptomyces sp. NBC_00124]|uniref:right-handed parallel beta-helix repeat-containing protein n=1 Tax=Streptomyces sp. NBC_00124 TaxID=2975662 RepID=UPI00224D06C8|nr:right-handed parallel beta-helix repeat-containing protein [Streptomyces sp. NBC_00124]MCX5359224.1 right-handed parallel beta-helix repeat-containing protein [Streptomyces sp. NBC_00124]
MHNRTRAGAPTAVALAMAVAVTVLPITASAEQPAAAPQLYVAPWGKDSWPGTLDRPFATPARAQQAARARAPERTSDLVVNLRGGTYTLKEPLRLSEAAGDSGVTYQAYGYGTPRQERVTLSGGRRISGWRPDPGRRGFWRADAGGLETRQLYVDGRRATRLSREGAGFDGTLKVTKKGYATTSTVPRSWKNPADIEFVYRAGYVEGRCGVAGVSGTSITMDQPCWDLAQALYEGPELLTSPTAVENSPSFEAEPGSWYLDRSRPGHHELLYFPRPGQDMRRAEVTAPVLENLVTGTGRPGRPLHDVGFRGLTFAYATWLAPSEPAGFPAAWSMYLRPGKGDDAKLLTVPGTVAFRTAERITLEGNRFTRLGAQALELSQNSSYNTVDGNLIDDVSDGGILMGVVPPDQKGTNRGNRITNNRIHHIGADYHAASAIWDTATQDTTIAHNQVDHVPYTGILSGPADDLRGVMRGNRILDNRVFATNRLLADGGGIYLRGEQGTSFADGAVISGNAVTSSRHGEWNVGIYTDDSTNWTTVDGNAVYDYVATIGGCSEEWGDRPVRNVRYRGNFWDDAVPSWLERRDFPGAWPPADTEHPDEGCGDPHDLEFTGNTLLPPRDPGRACAADAGCAAVLANAGPLPQYRQRLGMR